ncbi:MAG: nitrate reductase cytochrome c-type subunit [Rhodospirillales bacterium]|nr:nitrate reductase cytochrome c-type subunit [Rhodospirillales bacterium]MDH3911122.1 nitrate reductase cytochrome c-type subunit [Rhodospirillales bacterium]MDH3918125.1 nitrate reductase cytochrome c-type subunit [Rhodospirillales bacterium]MDH3965639.1 nitrate reductase cytochrome c-type subunit [Rhodospirillales bacterium]
MKKIVPILVGVSGLALAVLFVAPEVSAQSEKVESLRGPVLLEETNPAPAVEKQSTQDGGFARAYRQQPPLIPHEIDPYGIDAKANQCLGCHDWPYNADVGAPKVSETHYVDRNGVALDRVARARWFCTQCHVPQAAERPLVENSFKSAAEIE